MEDKKTSFILSIIAIIISIIAIVISAFTLGTSINCKMCRMDVTNKMSNVGNSTMPPISSRFNGYDFPFKSNNDDPKTRGYYGWQGFGRQRSYINDKKEPTTSDATKRIEKEGPNSLKQNQN